MQKAFTFGVVLCLALAARGLAEAPALVSEVIDTIPIELEELKLAHKNSPWKCRTLPAKSPIQIDNFAGKEVLRLPAKKGSAAAVAVPFSFSRTQVLTLGLDMQASDRKNLPFFSGGIIQDHLDSEYISIQAQVLRDSRTNEIYLHHQPFAAILLYSDRNRTHDFTDQSRTSAQDFRGLGVYIKPGEARTAKNARTLVASNMATMVTGQDKNGKPVTTDCYELVMVRAEVEGSDVTLHAFGTSHNRKMLHYLKQPGEPDKADECSVRTILIFTQYKLAGQVPVTSASRDATYQGLGAFRLDRLDDFCGQQGWKGGMLVNLTETLDAIIAGEAADYAMTAEEEEAVQGKLEID